MCQEYTRIKKIKAACRFGQYRDSGSVAENQRVRWIYSQAAATCGAAMRPTTAARLRSRLAQVLRRYGPALYQFTWKLLPLSWRSDASEEEEQKGLVGTVGYEGQEGLGSAMTVPLASTMIIC